MKGTKSELTQTPTTDEYPELWAAVSLHTEAELKEEKGVHFLSADIDVGGEGSDRPWVTIETNYMTSRDDGPLHEQKDNISFPCELIPHLQRMLGTLEGRAAACVLALKALEASPAVQVRAPRKARA